MLQIIHESFDLYDSSYSSDNQVENQVTLYLQTLLCHHNQYLLHIVESYVL